MLSEKLTHKTLSADFCVVGGGLSGMMAAVSASRMGLSVVLMQDRPVLGGNASAEIRMWICGANGKGNRETGLLEELLLENLLKNPNKNYYVWQMLLFDFVEREKNITLLLNCACLDANCTDGDYPYGRERKIDEVIGYQTTTQTFIHVKAKYFADCSGDSILAPLCHAEFMHGREGRDHFGEDTHVLQDDEMTMGMSLLLTARETEKKVDFTPPSYAMKLNKDHFEGKGTNLFEPYENFWYLELGGEQDTIGDTEQISKKLRSLSAGAWDYVKNSGELKDTQNWDLDFIGFLPGKRESRRYVGELILKGDDVMQNRSFPDEIAYGGWPMDDHFPGGFFHHGVTNTTRVSNSPYGIPYRCLYSKNINNLFFAGRNISVSHYALSTTRVMATCALLGQAVGVAVAIASQFGYTPHEVYLHKISLLQKTLLENDCFLPHQKRKVSPLCQSVCPSARLCDGQDRVNEKIYRNNEPFYEVNNQEPLVYQFSVPTKIESVHLVFDSDLDRGYLEKRGVGECEASHNMRANIPKNAPTLSIAPTLPRHFAVTIGEKRFEVENNEKRCYHFPVCREVKTISLTVFSNYGDTEKTPIISFDFA